MKTYLALLILAVAAPTISAQGFSDLRTPSGDHAMLDGRLKLFYRHTTLSGSYTATLPMSTLNFSLKWDSFGKNRWRYQYENAVLGDALFYMMRGFDRLNSGASGTPSITTDNTEKNLTSGLIGWHTASLNLWSSRRLLLSPGVHFGDHIISTTLRHPQLIIDAVGLDNYNGGSERTLDPAGYYLFAGPALTAAYVVDRRAWVEAHIQYDVSLVKAFSPSQNYVEIKDYPMPGVLMYGIELNTTYGVFAGLRIATLNDRGSYKNDARRVDLSIGYTF